jgi:hypothetical protein
VAAGAAAAVIGHPPQLVELRFRHLSLRCLIGSNLAPSAAAAGDPARRREGDTTPSPGNGESERLVDLTETGSWSLQLEGEPKYGIKDWI